MRMNTRDNAPGDLYATLGVASTATSDETSELHLGFEPEIEPALA